jgi:hypothetical protein
MLAQKIGARSVISFTALSAPMGSGQPRVGQACWALLILL